MFTHAHVSMITYRVDVYRSRPIGASLLTTSPHYGCLALKGLHTGADWAWSTHAASLLPAAGSMQAGLSATRADWQRDRRVTCSRVRV